MTFLDSAKQQLLEAMGDLEEIDFARTPSFFFLERLKQELEDIGMHDWVDPTLASIRLDISGLGLDYAPHEQWLSAMAKSYAQVVKKMVRTFRVFGGQVTRNQLANLSLKME
jgi:hypothetical protein